MRLFHSPASPFVRKVMLVLHETGQLGQVELVAATGNAVTPGTMPLAENPLGKLPTLVLGDGRALYDSRVICRYLDSVATGGLYPAEPRLWDSLVVEATADGIMDAAALMVYEGRVRPETLQFAPWVEGQWGKVTRALDCLETGWLGHLSGPWDIGQIAVGAALGYLDLRHNGRAWREGRPGLAGWFATASGRPAMQATVPHG
jgi:glutathione S-transferase